MPMCKAKYCTVRRGKGISTFPIPDPLKNKELCEKWINKLGIENLNIKTFQFSKDSIVCANHFEEDCFQVDMQAKIMGYTPRCRFLKKDAVPTIFKDSKPPQKRATSEKRQKKKERKQMIDTILNQSSDEPTRPDNLNQLVEEDCSTSIDNTTLSRMDKPLSRKRKLKPAIELFPPKLLVKDIPRFQDKETQVNFGIHDYPTECANCFARNNQKITLCDHQYSRRNVEQQDSDSAIGVVNRKNCGETSDAEITHIKTTDDNNITDEEDFYDMHEFSTPTKNEEKKDPTYIPDLTESPSTPQGKNADEKKVVNEPKYIVFKSCLDDLFSMLSCSTCQQHMDVDDINYRAEGTCISVSLVCMQGHPLKWQSQPLILNQPAGNILSTASTVISGGTFAVISNFAKALNLQFISSVTFSKIESDLVIPSIDKFWNLQRDIIVRNMLDRNLVVCGDGRCDSPGYSAKYCTYTIMDTVSSAILGFNVVQVTESNNSANKMELEGFKRTMSQLQDDGLNVVTIATDRHVQIRKCLKDNYPAISHQFDVWHLAKSIRKKLLAVAKKKGNEDLMPWVKSISNHLWYCACNCNGDADLLEEMWKSIIHHIQNVHSFEGKVFKKCGHTDLSSDEVRKKRWLKRDSKTLKSLEGVILDKRLLKDIRQVNLFCHTGNLESYHSMMLKYIPKRLAFKYPQMVARSQLSALDHNFNLKREQAFDSEGNPKFNVMFPKTTGRWTVRKLYVAKNYDYRQELLTFCVIRKLEGDTNLTGHQIKAKELPRNIATVAAPSKSELIESHVSRFKILQ